MGEGEGGGHWALIVRGLGVMVRQEELGRDVDKPFQLEICQQELAGR